MTKVLKIAAFLLIVCVSLTISLAVGMGYWMSQEPMHHGNHECCDFVPIPTSVAPSRLFILPPFAVAFLIVALCRPDLVEKQLLFVRCLYLPDRRHVFRGVVQRE